MGYVHIDDKIEPYFNLIMDCIKLKGKDIDKQIKRIVEDTETMNKCLEDEFLQFKLHCKKVRDEYEKAVSDEIEKTEKIWDRCDELVHNSQPKIENAKKDISGLLDLLKEVNEQIDGMQIYKVERLIELINEFNDMSDEKKELFSKFLYASKKE